MHAFSRVPPQTPFLPLSEFRDLKLLEANWQLIRDEAIQLLQMQKIKAAEKNDDAGFNFFFKNGWKRFYLKWYDASHPSAKRFCPRPVRRFAALAPRTGHARQRPHHPVLRDCRARRTHSLQKTPIMAIPGLMRQT
jgi:hypothetical protein